MPDNIKYAAVEFNQTRLTRWRRLLLLKDCSTILLPGGATLRSPKCVMCRIDMPAYRLQAHHVRPKSLYPDLAYDLDNGVMLCVGCHMGIVHAGNSFEDMSGIHHWKFFVPAFDRWNKLAAQRLFISNNQKKV